MNASDDNAPKPGRRDLLKLVGAGAVVALPAHQAAAQGAMPGMKAPADRPGPTPGYVFFNPDEAVFIEAVVDTFIPADEYTAAGTELGVAVFVDRQLDSGYGRGDRMYLLGPFMEGAPEQGYQLPLSPAEVVRAGILDVQDYVQTTHKTTFDALSPADRAMVLTDLQHRKIALATVPTGVFFDILFQLVMDGFFCDPIYGGNKGKASWKMLGYPGVGDMYANKIGPYRNKPYVVEPKSIQDLS